MVAATCCALASGIFVSAVPQTYTKDVSSDPAAPSSEGSTRGLILGIESSCDETAAAVVERGCRQLSSVVASQMATHAPFGGVVPELASREHLRNIVPVVRGALSAAKVGFRDLDAVAVTEGPGLAGALLVGITYAKTLAFALGRPLLAVNHLEGHIHAVLLQQSERHGERVPLPALALVVSGGHTHLYLARQQGDTWHYRNIGRTVDDAAGEAFDKVAKLLGLPYPGGPWIDALAAHGSPNAVPFAFSQIKAKAHRRQDPESRQESLAAETLFSFSGIKTAVLRYVEKHAMHASIDMRRQALAAISYLTAPVALQFCDRQTLDLIASFQHAVVENLKRRTFAAAEHYGVASLLICGGVAANSELRASLTAEAEARGLPIAFPSPALATDNAAMIAAAAWPKLVARDFAPLNISAQPNLRLGVTEAVTAGTASYG